MNYKFLLHDIFLDKLGSIKPEVFEEPLFQKTMILLDIWVTQKRLVDLLHEFDDLGKNKNIPITCSIYNGKQLSYKEQYISFLMNNDLIFLEEVKEPQSLLNLIYYFLVREVKYDKDSLDAF
ncbi:hypothetical protein [Alkaliphilus sp. B6464]|uniref:hypothetical protein n=1 Tax=Alkaliphilus sp. B6464 TaxID=2731219 RepID=UPI001BA6C3F3|nr:hypothetical protein [Alkaliphilus sp. B6464]QUH22100.1 hypothetical protein HYG84_19530 [Alkaliphilus sp. B6464]